jgi:hypothetical protein
MSKNQNNAEALEFEEIDDELYDDDEISPEDYGFILDANGDLKSVFMPENCMELPEAVKKICEVFGIDNPNDIYVHTLH